MMVPVTRAARFSGRQVRKRAGLARGQRLYRRCLDIKRQAATVPMT
jgi:hypothetical protein